MDSQKQKIQQSSLRGVKERKRVVATRRRGQAKSKSSAASSSSTKVSERVFSEYCTINHDTGHLGQWLRNRGTAPLILSHNINMHAGMLSHLRIFISCGIFN